MAGTLPGRQDIGNPIGKLSFQLPPMVLNKCWASQSQRLTSKKQIEGSLLNGLMKQCPAVQ